MEQIKRINDLYRMVALLIPVHVGQESCGGTRTEAVLEVEQMQRAIKVEVGPLLAARSTVLSAGSMRIMATPMTLVPRHLRAVVLHLIGCTQGFCRDRSQVVIRRLHVAI